MSALREIPRRRRVRGVTYGPAHQPLRNERRRLPRALRHLPPSDAAAVHSALTRYRDARLWRQYAPGMRALLLSLPPVPRARLEGECRRAAAGMEREELEREVLEVVENSDTGAVTLACSWQTGEAW